MKFIKIKIHYVPNVSKVYITRKTQTSQPKPPSPTQPGKPPKTINTPRNQNVHHNQPIHVNYFTVPKLEKTVTPSGPWIPTEALSQAQTVDDVPFNADPETSIPDLEGATGRKTWVQMGQTSEEKTFKRNTNTQYTLRGEFRIF